MSGSSRGRMVASHGGTIHCAGSGDKTWLLLIRAEGRQSNSQREGTLSVGVRPGSVLRVRVVHQAGRTLEHAGEVGPEGGLPGGQVGAGGAGRAALGDLPAEGAGEERVEGAEGSLEVVDVAYAGGLAERRRGGFAHGERVRSQVWACAEQVGEPLVGPRGVAGAVGDGQYRVAPAGVLAGVGFLMPPAVGAAVMSVSTIVVALNAQLLRRVRFSRPSAPGRSGTPVAAPATR